MRDDHRNGAIAMLAGLGIGAALMYFLDPQRGSARRAQAVGQTSGALRSARRDLDVTRRDLRNRAQGAKAELRSRLQGEEVDDRLLAERVRAEAGHHVESSLRRVEVTAHQGTVTLRGEVAPEDHGDLVDAALDVRGVREVRDELTETRR